MLALSCFNYINIAIVSAARRLKEIAVRKTIGASKSSTMMQFLVENVLVTFLALLVGTCLAVLLFLPWFADLSEMPLSVDFGAVKLWVFLLVYHCNYRLAFRLVSCFVHFQISSRNYFQRQFSTREKKCINESLLMYPVDIGLCLAFSSGHFY